MGRFYRDRLASAKDTLDFVIKERNQLEKKVEELEVDNRALRAEVDRLRASTKVLVFHPLDAWDERDGDALWWTLPVQEPPYCGTPLNDDWPGGHTHWSPLPSNEQIESAERAVGVRRG